MLFRQIGDWRFLAHTLGILGYTVLSNGDLESAEKFLDEAFEVNQKINNIEIEYVLTGKAILCMLRGKYDQARTFLQKNIEDHEKSGDRMGYLWGHARLGYVALREGKLEEAHQLLVNVIENFHADQNKNGLTFALDRMASLYALTDKPDIAAHLIGWSDANRMNLGDPRPHIEQADLDLSIASIKAKLGANTYESAYNTGRELTLDNAMAFASSVK